MNLCELLHSIPNPTSVRLMVGKCTVYCGKVAELPFAIVRDQTVVLMCAEKDERGEARVLIVLEMRDT